MNFKNLGKWSLGCLLFIIIGLTLAVYFVNKKVSYLSDHPKTSGNTVSIILIDGLSQNVFEEAIANNQLPNLKSLLTNGTYVKNGIGSFPSMTGYAFYPFITGVDATKSGILGLRWFDRSLDVGNLRNYVGRTNVYMNEDITDTIKNIFELSGDMYTASINSFMNKGVDDGRITGWTHTTAKFEGKSIFGPMRSIPVVGEELAKNHFQHETEVFRMAKDQLIKNPKVQWIALPSPDASHHVFGMTDNYLKLLEHIDRLIGDFRNTIDSLGQKKTRMIAIVTDHGVSEVDINLDIVPLSKQKIGLDLVRGNAVNYKSMYLSAPLSDFIEKDGYWVINGNLCAYLYLRNPSKTGSESWRHNLSYKDLIQYKKGEKTINIPKSFAEIEGIQLVIYKKDASNIVVQNKEGAAVITKLENKYQYHIDSADPLEYADLQLVDTFLTKDQWIENTIESTYPDAIYRLFALMQTPNIGDLVITSQEGYDLAKNYEVIVYDYKGGHGGLRGDQLRVPYIIYANGLPKNNLNYARAEDIGIMIKNWLGFNHD
jgi:predicted AlkP superfamily pyrophosphatase or phosphodiesterase